MWGSCPRCSTATRASARIWKWEEVEASPPCLWTRIVWASACPCPHGQGAPSVALEKEADPVDQKSPTSPTLRCSTVTITAAVTAMSMTLIAIAIPKLSSPGRPIS